MNKSFDISKVTSETYLSFVHVEACGSHLCILCNDGRKWDRNGIKRHVKDYHLKTHVEVQGRYLYLCLDKSCCNEGHYHCLVCEKPFKKNRVKKHIESQHKGKSVETSDVVGVMDSRTIKKVKKVKCHVCNEEMYARNLKIHQQRKHGGKKHVEVYKYNGICIHAEEGLYLVTEHLSGIQKPIHVVKKIATNGEQKFFCESKPCRATRDAACRSGLLNYECIHLEAVKHVTNTADATNLNNDSLGKLVSEHIISEDTKAQLQQLKNDARCNSAPLVVLWESQPRDSQRYLFVSVRDTSVHNYSLTGRVLVTVDMEKKFIRCNCSSGRRGCLHKAVTKWCLAEKSLLFIESVQNDDDDLQFSEWSETAAALGESRDTNADDDLKKLATYWLHEKHIPFSIPREFLQINHHPGMVVSASEEHCYFCEHDLISLEPSDGYIITFKSLVRGIKVQAKSCPGCKMNYWPQDYKTGLLNFNNSIFISLELLVFLRSGLMEHTAIGRSLNILERLHGHKIKHHTVIKAYFMYDAFSRNSHSFSCNDCGQHPAIMNFDVNRKAAFRMPKISLEKDKSYSDKVNVKAFWERVFLAAICDGVFYEKMNPYAVDPNFENWAPWMAPEMLKENDYCLNTEYKKLSDDVDDSEINILHNLTEERLEQLLLKGTREELAELCQSCKITSKCRTKLDMVLALKSAIQANAQVDKFFFKIFHASGGVLIGTCPHGISLSIKWLLRAESPRDSTDLLLSMKYPPNVVLSDVPHMLAAHTNKRQTDFFYPNSGRVVSDTNENIEKALDGSLPNQTFPWLKRMHEPCLEKYYLEKPRMGKVHPITLVQSRYSLYDPFHEGNTTQAKEVLRRTGFVKELNGVLNRETAEQMNRIVSKDVYFLDEMLPRHHMQMMLSLLGCRNVQKNKEFDQLLVNSFGEQFTLKLDPFGRRLLENICGSSHGDKESTTISAATNITLQSIVPSKAFWTDVPQGYIDGFSADSELPCSHFIFTDASPFKIRREDILTLLPGDDVGRDVGRDVDGNVLDMLLLLCGAVAALHGINVCVLPSHFLASLSWDLSQECLIPDSFENVHCMFTLSSRPGHWCLTGFDKRSCKIIYLDPLGRDISSNQIALQHVQIVKTLVWRYVLYNDLDCPEDLDAHGWGLVTARNFMEEFNSPLPMQLCSTDCGIFSLMYGLYIMQFSRFDFSQSDMVKIRYQLFRIICNCSNDPRLVTYISHTTTGSWPLFERDGGGGGDDGGGGGGGDDGGGGGGGDDQFGLHIDVLPNEILGQILLFLCLDNASEKSVLKLVCRRWLKCLDTAFDNWLYEKRLLLKINEAKSRYKFRHILEDSIKACEWLLKNHRVLKKKPSLPLMLTTNDSFLKEIEDLVRFDEQPRPDEAAGIDPEFLYDWVTDRIRRIHEAREFEFYAMEDMVRFLAETDVEVSAKCVT